MKWLRDAVVSDFQEKCLSASSAQLKGLEAVGGNDTNDDLRLCRGGWGGEIEEGVLPSFLLLSLNWPTHALNGPIKRYNFFTFPALEPCEFLLFGFP